ncbi:DUF4136 domain-containing protein [Sphingomonas antarctica]|uniref:DUF4136 domain-containing protein n=1 Tax=Sphingomonas antarctica TaxID=2040274 RepID=UPI0039E810FF
MKTLMKFAAPLSLLAVAGCAAPFQAKVSRFQNLPAPQGQSFTIRTDNPRLQNSLEFSQYANLVAQRLGQVGYARAETPGSANLVVTVNYMVDQGRERIETYPSASGPFGGRFGFGGFGYGGWHRGYGGFGGGFGRGYYSGFYDPFLFDDYRDVESYTIYTSELDMKIERPGTRERVFEGRAQAQSTNKDLTTTVPNLIDAMFTNFPGNSGETVKITIAPAPKNRR